MEREIIHLLDNQNQLVLRILELISESKRWYSVSEISLELNVVERTVQRYIHQLEELIDDYNEERHHQVDITYEKYKGVFLEIQRGSNYTELKSYILENDDTIKIFKDIIFENFTTIKKYSMTHFLSETLVRKSIKKIKEFLDSYQLGLSRNTFRIIGDEKQIRLVIYIIGWVIFKGVTWPFESIDKAKVYRSVDMFSDSMSLHFSEIHRKQMGYILAINLIRLRKNHIVPMEEEWKNYVDAPKLMNSMPVLKKLIQDYNIYIESEIYYYVIIIQMKVKIYESDEFKQRVFSYHQKNQSDVFHATQTFIERFSETFVPIPKEIEERFFITSFSAHMFCKLFKHVRVDIDGYLVLEDIDTDSPILQRKLTEFIHALHRETKNDLFLEEEFLLQKYLLLFSSVLPLTHYEPEITIYLDTDFPYFVEQNIIMRLTDRYKHDFNIVFADKKTVTEWDLILTNIPNIIEEKQRLTYKVHLFDFPIKLRDFLEIEKKLKIIAQERCHYID